MENKKIILVGGSGFIGQCLINKWSEKNQITVIGRQGKKHNSNYYGSRKEFDVKFLEWDGKSLASSWTKAFEKADLVVNLAGRSVNCRYHENERAELISSRVNATRLLGEAIRNCVTPPKLWINLASATIYRNEYESPNDETSGRISIWRKDNMPYSLLDRLRTWKNRLCIKFKNTDVADRLSELEKDFSVKICQAWEQEFYKQETPFTRKVLLRSAIVLGDGGVMVPYRRLAKLGLGGRHGSGKQFFSWIHIDDFANILEWAMDREQVSGTYNAVSPKAITNSELMAAIRKSVGIPFGLPAPVWLLEIGAFLIRTETELMLKSRWAIPTRLLKEGFKFKITKISEGC